MSEVLILGRNGSVATISAIAQVAAAAGRASKSLRYDKYMATVARGLGIRRPVHPGVAAAAAARPAVDAR